MPTLFTSIQMYIEGPEEVTKSGNAFDELQRRIAGIELSRDENVMKVEQMQATLRRNQSKYNFFDSSFIFQIFFSVV